MPLAQYTDTFWFPDGVLAAATPARIFPLNSNTLAPIFTDATGTTPLPNPLNTDGAGVLTFWAEEAEYWIHIDTETFRVSVGTPNVDVFEASTASLSTGVLSGGELNVNALVPTSVDIGATVGYIMDFVTDPEIPSLTRVSTAAQTVAMTPASLARPITWWLMDAAGVVTQQGTRPTNTQRRDLLVIGSTLYDSVAGMIINDQSIPVALAQLANQVMDLMDAMGPFSITGNIITPNGANLSLNKSAGEIFARSFNRFAGPTLTKDPHVTITPAQTPATLRRFTQLSSLPIPLPVTTIDPGQRDNGGVLVPVAGNDATIQRVWLFPANDVSAQIGVQYGQTAYPSVATALDRLGQSGFVESQATVGIAALIAYVVVRGNATDLTDTAQCVIKRPGKLDFP